MDYVQRFAQAIKRNDERDVGLRGTLRAGNHVDTVATQCAEELTRNTWGVLHVLTHDSYGGKTLLGGHIIDFACGNLLGKLGIEHGTGELGIAITYTDRGAVL